MSKRFLQPGLLATWVVPMERQFASSMSRELFGDLHSRLHWSIGEAVGPLIWILHRELRGCDE